MFKDRLLVAAIFAATEIDKSDHPNELKFKGVLVQLDSPSTKAPNGSQGHRILIPKALAEKRYKTLLGMGVNYANDLDKHQPTRKVGVIKKAWIEGSAIHVSGIIWKKDFPDAEKDLKQSNLGMSFEASDIDVEDSKADIWVLSDLCFTGAAILYKASAAYYNTKALAASAMSAQLIKTNNGGEQMPNEVKKKKKTDVAASSQGTLTASALVAALTAANKPILDAINANNANLVNLTNSIEAGRVAEVEAKAKKAMKKEDEGDDEGDDDDEDEDDDDMDSSMDDEEASLDDDADDADDLEDLDDEDNNGNDDTDKDPGHINKNVKTWEKGDKTTVSTKEAKNKEVTASLSSLKKTVDQLAAAREADQATIKSLTKQLAKKDRALEAAGDRTDRRSISLSAAAQNLLSKEGLNANDMSASGAKMTVDEFDACASKAGIGATQRVAMKTELARAGVMEEGIVRRSSIN